jgi:hypothetical protein
MSLIAPLFGLPGKIRKLRGHNAPKAIAAGSLNPAYYSGSDNPPDEDDRIYRYVANDTGTNARLGIPAAKIRKYSNFGLNNSNVVQFPILDMTGPGAVDLIAFVSIVSTIDRAANVAFGISIVLDEQELMAPGWEGSGIHQRGSTAEWESHYNCINLVGQVYLPATLQKGPSSTGPADPAEFLAFRESSPLTFKQSLQVTLEHRQSDDANRWAMWSLINAWQTE